MRLQEAVTKKILALCKIYDIAPNKLATISAVPQSTINNIISGRNNTVELSTIFKICQALEMTLVEFLSDSYFLGLEQEVK